MGTGLGQAGRGGRELGRGTDAGRSTARGGSADGRAATCRRARLHAQSSAQELSCNPVMRPGTERLFSHAARVGVTLEFSEPPAAKKEEGPHGNRKQEDLGIKGGSQKGGERLGLGSRKPPKGTEKGGAAGLGDRDLRAEEVVVPPRVARSPRRGAEGNETWPACLPCACWQPCDLGSVINLPRQTLPQKPDTLKTWLTLFICAPHPSCSVMVGLTH